MQHTQRPPRQRAPRVQMTYDVEIGGSVEQRELPFVIGVLGDFAGDSDTDKRRLKERSFVALNRDNLDEVMAALAPRAKFPVPNLIDGDESTFEVDLRFASLRDFRPEAVLPQIEPLRRLLEARNQLASSRTTEPARDVRLADIDQLVTRQLCAVLHAPALQQLESSWTGLHYLVSRGEPEHNVVVRILNASKKELIKDFQGAVEFDHSTLFRRVYEEEFGTFGGAPFGVLLGDYEITRQPGDLYLLEQIAKVAAAAHAPFVTAAAPGLFGMESFADLGLPRELAKLFDTADYARWKAFRQSEDARYVGLTLPRFLGRLPYHPANGSATHGFHFIEDVDGADASSYLWCNAAYAFGARLMHAFADYGWCAAIRGIDGGGLVDDLPVDSFRLNAIAPKCSTDVVITDRREKELSDLGFIALVHCKHTRHAAFYGAQSAQRARKYDSDAANANAVLSSQLQYIFAVSRIAHYMKVMMRDKIGSFVSSSEVEDFLNRWVTRYVLLDDDATVDQKAQFPLREASVHVAPVGGRPGVYRAVAFLRPHFQLDELSVSLRLVAELPASTH